MASFSMANPDPEDRTFRTQIGIDLIRGCKVIKKSNLPALTRSGDKYKIVIELDPAQYKFDLEQIAVARG